MTLLEKFRNAEKTTSAPLPYGSGSLRGLGWLNQRIERGKKEPFSEIATITPDIARHMLERNEDNRPIRDRLVRQIASDIGHGLWQLNGEAIIIARDGSLNDGQHRLSAIVESGTPIQTVVMFGVARESRYTVDMGTARGVGDLLGMQGKKYGTLCASISTLYMGYKRGVYTYGGSKGVKSEIPTKQAVHRFYTTQSKAIDRAAERVGPNVYFCKNTPTVWGVAYIIMSKIDPSAAEEFFHKAATGENLKRGDAILTMRTHFMEMGGLKLRPHQKLELVLRYWSAWRAGKSVLRRLPLQGAYPEV